MKLFYKPGACSLASHIILRETQTPFELEEVNFQTGKTTSGIDYSTISTKGYIPSLQLDSKEVITEGAAILQFIADQAVTSQATASSTVTHLIPPPKTIGRAHLQEHLNFISSELHKAFGPLFSDHCSEEEKTKAKSNVGKKLSVMETVFEDQRSYLLGESFTVADAYLFVVVNWSFFVNINLQPWPHILAFHQRILDRPSVQQSLQAEGLV